MDALPTNPAMLVSAINMLLRDGEYENLDDLCAAFDRDPAELCATLEVAGYTYSAEQHRFY